jgi:hypothetical protein
MAYEMPSEATGAAPVAPWTVPSLKRREWLLRAHVTPGAPVAGPGNPPSAQGGRFPQWDWLVDQAAEWGYDRGREQGDVDAAAAADAELEACREFLEHRGQHHLAKALMEMRRPVEPDRSDEADAARLRWILNGNGYFLEEYGLCGHGPGEEDEARREIDKRMAETE